MIRLNNLLNEETFTATNKASGKTSVFKSKDSRDAAIKAGTHSEKEDDKSTKTGGKTSKVNIFDKPAKDSSTTTPSSEILVIYKNKARINKTKSFTDAKAAQKFADANDGTLAKMVDGKLVGMPKTSVYTKDEIPYNADTITPKSDMGVDKVVYNTRTKSVGIVRLGDERGETKTDADGNVNTSELEPYNPMKYPHQKDAKVAPSTQKEIDSRGLWKPFAQDKETSKEEPTQTASEPKKKRPGNPAVNKEAKKLADKFGLNPNKMSKEDYITKMYQAAVAALTDSNFHSEARELVAAIEGNPEWAKRPVYPSLNDPKFKEKMADIRTNSADSSIYMNPKDEADDYGTEVSQASGWDGVDAADGIAFTLRMNGFHKQADMIQSIFDNKPYMKNEGRISLSKLMNESEAEEIANLTGLRTQAVQKFIDDNNINDRKLLAYLKIKGPKTLSNRMDISTAIVGKPGNKFAQGIIKAFSK